ncbi:MAG: phage major capsid protein, partial [Pseudomonadota bacterium]
MAKSQDVRRATAETIAAFEAYKRTNDDRLAAIEKRGAADPLLDEKLAKIDRRLEALSLKSARAELEGSAVDLQDTEHVTAWDR